jgi:hypothetical protein
MLYYIGAECARNYLLLLYRSKINQFNENCSAVRFKIPMLILQVISSAIESALRVPSINAVKCEDQARCAFCKTKFFLIRE